MLPVPVALALAAALAWPDTFSYSSTLFSRPPTVSRSMSRLDMDTDGALVSEATEGARSASALALALAVLATPAWPRPWSALAADSPVPRGRCVPTLTEALAAACA